jgi:multidrug resistance efflux pump
VPILLALGGAGCVVSPAPDNRPIAATIVPERAFQGVVQPALKWRIPFAVSGTVTAVRVAAGDRVGEGALLAELDATAFEDALAASEQTLREVRSRLEVLGNYMRPEDVLAFLPSVTASPELDSLRASVLQAEIARATALARAVHSQRAVGLSRVTSPMPGVVVAVPAREGERVDAGSVAVEMMDDAWLAVVTRIPAEMATGLRAGRRAQITVSAVGADTPRFFDGQVSRVDAGSGGEWADVVLRVVESGSLPLGASVLVRFP